MIEPALFDKIIYAGLVGVAISLVVATIQNNWSIRVFFLLALRLAIGWQFLFEGLNKVQSHHLGATETNRVFTSEPYFKVAPGPIGAYMRSQFEDTEAIFKARIRQPVEITARDFAKLSNEEQANHCPEVVAKEFDALLDQVKESIKTEVEKDLQSAKDEKQKAFGNEILSSLDTIAAKRVTDAKLKYARWVYGVESRDAKIKSISGDVQWTAPQRLSHIEFLRKALKLEEEKPSDGLGNGYGIEQKRLAEFRTDLIAAESDLVKDARSFEIDLMKDGLGVKDAILPAANSKGQLMDKITMWFLVGVGSCLLAGFLTRFACVGAAGFLIMTYLTHPAFPWFPAPPNTEGNPLFINKNAIECLALLALASMPTGRWMGVDALLFRCCRRDN